MGLRLFNTASQQLEPVPTTGDVRMYVCGITPDGTTHLGHAFTYIHFDTLVRYLRFRGAAVRYVQNVTDVDDDILARARAAHITSTDMAEMYLRDFRQQMARLNVAPPDVHLPVSGVVAEMQTLIERLKRAGFCYERVERVYFRVARVP